MSALRGSSDQVVRPSGFRSPSCPPFEIFKLSALRDSDHQVVRPSGFVRSPSCPPSVLQTQVVRSACLPSLRLAGRVARDWTSGHCQLTAAHDAVGSPWAPSSRAPPPTRTPRAPRSAEASPVDIGLPGGGVPSVHCLAHITHNPDSPAVLFLVTPPCLALVSTCS